MAPAIAIALGSATLVAVPASAQVARDSSTTWLLSAGSEGERYLRTLQVAGLAPLTQWSVRPFSVAGARRLSPDAVHPWQTRFDAAPARSAWWRLIEPTVGGVVNSSFPYGFNDGPAWTGRGLTLIATAGVQGALGPLELTLAPEFFRAQNARFPLDPNGRTGAQAYADPHYPLLIDLPQRFGDGAYQRIDPGQSTLQLRGLRLAVGASTANEFWGPAIESPFLLGNNAAGFAHLFAGTDGPIALGPLRFAVRFIAGRLEQSAYSTAAFADRRRYLAGMVATVGIAQIPGLEVGLGRIFEGTWPDSGLSFQDIVDPLFQNPFKVSRKKAIGGDGSEPDNQIGSLFARWAFPSAGVEVYGELGREDNAYDERDLLLEPDHDVAYLLGLQRVWKRPRNSLLALRAELLNTRVTQLELVRSQAPPYTHTPVRQGHTQYGQVLGAPYGFGGGNTVVALDWFTPGGRTTVSWRRSIREPAQSAALPYTNDLFQALTVDGLLFRRRVDLAPEASLVYNLNRYGQGDQLDLRVAAAAVVHW